MSKAMSKASSRGSRTSRASRVSQRAARDKIRHRAKVFQDAMANPDATTQQTLDRMRAVSSLEKALGDDSDKINVAVIIGSIAPRRASDVGDNHGTKKDDAKGVFGSASPEDFQPHVWGFGEDKRQNVYESGSKHAALREQHRRHLSVSKTSGISAADAPGLIPMPPDGSQPQSRRSTKDTAASGGTETAVLQQAPGSQMQRLLMRQQARVDAMRRKFEDGVDDHRAADRDAIELEGAMLIMANKVGDALQNARDRAERDPVGKGAHKW